MAQVVSSLAVPDAEPKNTVLSEILAENRVAGAELRDGNVNQLSVAIIGLDRLGAPAPRLPGFASAYRRNRVLLPPPVSPGRITRENWRGYLSDRDMEHAYRSFFEAELVRLGRDALLREYLPDLMEGVAASGFQPIVRLAYALEQDDDPEVVVALAYWATTFLPLGHAHFEAPGRADPRAVLDRLQASMNRDEPSRHGHRALVSQLHTLAEDETFGTVIHWLHVDDRTMRGMAEACLCLFAQSRDHAALMALAATRSFRLLLPWLFDPIPAIRYHWQAVSATYLVLGSPEITGLDDLEARVTWPVPEWRQIREKAVASDDVDAVLAVHACQDECMTYGFALYRAVAAACAGQGG